MTKTKTERVTRRSVLASFLALAVCMSMLIGTSYAWFTDSVTSSGNIIKSGKLSIDLGIKTKDDADYVSVKNHPDKKAFNYELWEPGYTEWVNAKVSTDGNLALKYTMRIVANGEVSELADVIDVYYKPEQITKPTNRDLSSLKKLGTLADAINGTIVINDTLIPGANNTEDFATLALHMQETAGNQYQDMSIGTDFSFQLLATQYTYEEDTFGDDYDANADGKPDNANFLGYTSVSAKVAASGETKVGDVNLNGIEALIPSGGLAEAVTNVTLNDKPTTDSDAVVTVGTDNGITASYFDLTLVDQNSNPVEIQDNKIVTVRKDVGKDILITEVNHRTTPLTTSANANGEYYAYDADTGILTLYLASFSPFSIGYATQWAVFPTLNNKVCIGDDALYEAMYVASEAAVTDLANKVYLDALYEADFGFCTLDAHSAICQFMIGGCNGMRPTSIDNWAWQLGYVKDGTTKEQVLAMQQQYFDAYKALVESVEFYPQNGGVWGWAPWPFGMEPELAIW